VSFLTIHGASGLGATAGLIAEIADELVGTGAANMVVVDSVAALVSKAEIKGGVGRALWRSSRAGSRRMSRWPWSSRP
jgi:RecA/RadA recombinase